jgi:ribosome biogenesis protein UTP30
MPKREPKAEAGAATPRKKPSKTLTPEPASAKQSKDKPAKRGRAADSDDTQPDAAPPPASRPKTGKPAAEPAAPKEKGAKKPTAAAPLTLPKTTGPLDAAQVARAAQALLTHVQRESSGLLDDEPPVHVLIATKQMPKAVGKAAACKPIPLKLPHPYLDLDDAEVCLITKDPQREFKDRLAAEGVRAKVIGVSKLKKKYHEYEAKRQLLNGFQVFLADARVLPMLPPLLGKAFFQKKRLPTAVDLKKKALRPELERAACGALFRHATGTSNSVQVGTAGQSVQQLTENIVAVAEQAVQHIHGKWNNVQALSLRTTNSVALPFYSSLPHA